MIADRIKAAASEMEDQRNNILGVCIQLQCAEQPILRVFVTDV